MANNKVANVAGELSIIATEAMKPSRIYQWGTRAVFVPGVKEYAVGDLALVVFAYLSIRMTTQNTAVFALDADVFYDPADNQCYPGTAAGRFVMGKADRAHASGDGTELLVGLNRGITI